MKYSTQSMALVSSIFLYFMNAPAGMAQPSAAVKPHAQTSPTTGQGDTDHDHAADKGSAQDKSHDHAQDKSHDHAQDKSHDHAQDKSHDHAQDKSHDHAQDKKQDAPDHDHEEAEKDHGHGHGHGEEKSNVGPNKGVTEASENKGFSLKEKVERNFSIQRMKLTSKSPLIVPTQSLLFSGAEKQIFRFRDGFWKAVDVQILKRGPERSTVASKELTVGDSIAITGVGFLKIINQSVFGPAIEGHVH